MSDLKIQELKVEQARVIDFNTYDITLKRDGTLIYFKNNELESPRCNRSERFKHILDILKDNNFPNCFGEMYMDKPNANVFDVSRSENWEKVKFMPIDLIDSGLNYAERQLVLLDKIKKLNNPFITKMIRFEEFDEGWKYVLDNESEGLVIRDENNWYKVKILQEVKIEIKEHEKGKNKGTFILINGNKVSGTSEDFVNSFHKIKAENKKPIAEIEYCFLTKDNKYFQPRLRQITIDVGEVVEVEENPFLEVKVKK